MEMEMLLRGYPSQLKSKSSLEHLCYEPDFALAIFFFNSIRHGFAVVDDGEIPSYYQTNHKLATSAPAKMFLYILIKKEIQEFKYDDVKTQPHCICALGAVPKGKSE